MRYSVIIPVFNTEQYLEECIMSVLLQSFNDYEIVLIDDGSEAETARMCDEFGNRDKRVKVIHQTNQGLSLARNRGIEEADGEYLIFLDSDDCLADEALEILNKIIDENVNLDVIINRTGSFDEKGYHSLKGDFGNCIHEVYNGVQAFKVCMEIESYLFSAWTLVVRYEFLKQNSLLFFPHLYHEDELWTPKVILNAAKVLFNEKIYYYNRVNREGSITQSANIKKEFDKLFIIEQLLNLYSPDTEQGGYVRQRCSKILLGCIQNFCTYKDNEDYIKLKEMIRVKLYLLSYKSSKSFKYSVFLIIIRIFGINLAQKLL